MTFADRSMQAAFNVVAQTTSNGVFGPATRELGFSLNFRLCSTTGAAVTTIPWGRDWTSHCSTPAAEPALP